MKKKPPLAAALPDRAAVLEDYRTAWLGRFLSIVARQEVFSGKAKFGIFGDGKEAAQVALARAFRPGDFRSGYYRDQALMLALGLVTPEQFFAQLYAHADPDAEPWFGGRHMTGHYATRLLDADGRWRHQLEGVNSSADLSPTAAQMPRLVGLALASKLYRRRPDLGAGRWSDGGNEIAFGTIGNASCAEGAFWESINAVAVMQAPMLLAIWDDGYGISVPNELQLAKSDISIILEGFRESAGAADCAGCGIRIFRVCGWDYAALYRTFQEAAAAVRRDHVPGIVHVTELTQPHGHSTSGSQERYKPPERLKWEREHDCLLRMRAWLISGAFATPEELNAIEGEEKAHALDARDRAWSAYRAPLDAERDRLLGLLEAAAGEAADPGAFELAARRLREAPHPLRRDLLAAAAEAQLLGGEDPALTSWIAGQKKAAAERYGSHLYSESARSPLRVTPVPARYSEQSPVRQGFEILNACFDAAFERHPELVAMGEDVGRLGDVNQGFAGLQAKYGADRVMDTGIREATIIGQAIGLALRGFRPIAEIQYLDYIHYALEVLSDDLASLRWRTRGGQKAPVIIRTRGHRLEGIWHSGSPMAGILNLVRGIHVCVPRDATQAAGFYNTLFRSDDPALVVEVLNGYRLRAPLPDNIGEFSLPLGVPETVRPGRDVTIATYGACCAIALEAAGLLARAGIEAEVVDVRTLLPFDIEGRLVESLRRTHRILFVDEDVPGGATAYMMQKVIEQQGGFDWLLAPPRTLPAREHRPAAGGDGDYFSKPNREEIVEAVRDLVRYT